MPLPEKQPNETKPEFIARCMADAQAITDFPEAPQRFAVCQAQWQK
jgi:hypothetical protein